MAVAAAVYTPAAAEHRSGSAARAGADTEAAVAAGEEAAVPAAAEEVEPVASNQTGLAAAASLMAVAVGGCHLETAERPESWIVAKEAAETTAQGVHLRC